MFKSNVHLINVEKCLIAYLNAKEQDWSFLVNMILLNNSNLDLIQYSKIQESKNSS